MNTFHFIADPRGDALLNLDYVTKISRGWDAEGSTYHIFLTSSVDDGTLWEFTSESERDALYAQMRDIVAGSLS